MLALTGTRRRGGLSDVQFVVESRCQFLEIVEREKPFVPAKLPHRCKLPACWTRLDAESAGKLRVMRCHENE